MARLIIGAVLLLLSLVCLTYAESWKEDSISNIYPWEPTCTFNEGNKENEVTVTVEIEEKDEDLYKDWYMSITSNEIGCDGEFEKLSEKGTIRTVTISSCKLLLGQVEVMLTPYRGAASNENMLYGETQTVYCKPAQSGLGLVGDVTNPTGTGGVQAAADADTSIKVVNVTGTITMDIQKQAVTGVGESNQISVNLTADSIPFYRMLLTVILNNGNNVFEMVTQGCINTPTGAPGPFNMTGTPDGEAPYAIVIDWFVVLPFLFPQGAPLPSAITEVTVTAIAELCPLHKTEPCFVTDGCSAGVNKLGRRRKRQATGNPIAAVKQSILVYPSEDTRKAIMDKIVAEYGGNRTSATNSNELCVDEGLFAALVVLVAIGFLAAVLTLLFVALRYRKTQIKSGSSTISSNSSRKPLPYPRSISSSERSGSPRNGSPRDTPRLGRGSLH